MRADSTLTASQREELVALFEQGFSYGAAANRVGVRHGPAKNLYQRFKLRGRLCLVRKRRKQEYSFEVKKQSLSVISLERPSWISLVSLVCGLISRLRIGR